MITPFKLPNWEVAAFYFIQSFVRGTERQFTRQQIMKKIDEIIPLFILLGHKQKPTHPEETMQRTLQNMRDKNWIDFLGKGEYALTSAGFNKLEKLNKDLESIRALTEAFNPQRKEIINGELCLDSRRRRG